MYIEKINSPADVKGLSSEELTLLSDEIRQLLLQKLSDRGGHFGPNLGDVELTIALHYIFDSPKDKLVFDVSHQTYTHKILTGRKNAWIDSAHYGDVTGFSNPEESDHDFFTIGHTSTSISLAAGLAKARDLKGDSENVVAIIGDGSLSGGEAFEGFNHVSELGTNFIAVINDNEMSIAENHGGLYPHLAELRATGGKASNNFFKALGFDYIYVEEGHDVAKLIEAFKSVKDSKKPVVVHVHTIKGKGYAFAEADKENYHYKQPFDIPTGKNKYQGGKPGYGALSCEYLLKKMQEKKNLVVITSGTPTILGFTKDKRDLAGKQFVDVGIAEEHAVALSSGIAKNGGRPVYGVFSTFLERSYDQLLQDLCINNNPAVLVVCGASANGMKDITHLGFYDIPFMAHIPNLLYLAPSTQEEYFAMLDWAIEQTSRPVAIRQPCMGLFSRPQGAPALPKDYSKAQYEIAKKGSKVALLALGDMLQTGEKTLEFLAAKGINATLINPRFISELDTQCLEELKKDHQLVVTIEDGVLNGGWGEKIARYYGLSDMKVECHGIGSKRYDGYDLVPMLEENRMTAETITEDILKNL